MANANWQPWWRRLLSPVTVLSGFPAWPVHGAASERVGPAIWWTGCLTMSRKISPDGGVAAGAPLNSAVRPRPPGAEPRVVHGCLPDRRGMPLPSFSPIGTAAAEMMIVTPGRICWQAAT